MPHSNLLSTYLAFFICVSVPCHAVAATKILEIPGEVQRTKRWCWAATSAMAVNSFSATTGRTVTQGELAAYQIREIKSLADLAAIDDQNSFNELQTFVDTCEASPSTCDVYGKPLLLGLKHDEGKALSWTKVKQQIDRGRPFLFTWNYVDGHRKNRPEGLHQLIAVGYSESSGKHVFVWDPWPAHSDTASTPKRRLKRISYATFLEPKRDMGVRVEHGSDLFNLRIGTSRTRGRVNAPRATSPQRVEERPSRHSMSFEEALRSSAPVSRASDALAPLPPISNVEPERAPRSLESPFPIVTLSLDDLRNDAIDLETLFRPETSTVLYPIAVLGEIVDATLAFISPDGWQTGGYASTEVARLLVERRSRLRGEQDTYVVAIPALATFFLARDFGSRTELTPIVDDGIFTTGRTLPARAVLATLAENVKNQLDP